MKGVWGAFLFFAAVPACAQDSLVSIGDGPYLTDAFSGGRVTFLRYPTLGLPEIVRAGNTARAILKLPSAADAQATIAATGDATPVVRALPFVSDTPDPATGTTTVRFTVPADVPEDTYDLLVVVPSAGVADQQPNCFRVVAQETSTFTYAIIADPQFNDPRGVIAPGNRNPNNYNVYGIIQQIKKELRAHNPTFAIMCGDLTFGMDYTYEYEGAWNVWKDTGVPIFMVPGNHDGYASTVTRTVLGITSPQRDGLESWRRYLGPTCFSFDFGGLHFQGVNSYDGTPARRDSFLIIVENYGGDLAQPQMDWIATDTAGRSLVVPFMHHNPLGPYHENRAFSLTSFIINRIIDFITAASIADLDQVWNTQATGAFLMGQYLGKAPFVWVGHEHKDGIKPYQGSIYKLVTDCASGGEGYWGYAIIRVVNGVAVDWLYEGAQSQSIPAGNLHVTVNGPLATVTSGLSRAYDVTIEFLLPQASAYSVTGGTFVRAAPAGPGVDRVWVRAMSSASSSIDLPVSSTVTVTATASAVASASTLSGGGCSAPGRSGNAVAFAAALAILLLARYLAR